MRTRSTRPPRLTPGIIPRVWLLKAAPSPGPRARHLVERRHVDPGGVEDDDVGLLARSERAGLSVEPQMLRAVDGGEAQHVARREQGRRAGRRRRRPRDFW